VFGRTFSALILGEMIAYDGKADFLTQAELEQILEAGLHYLAEEQDLRGYVPDKGWAHSAAHTADLLFALVRHPGLGVAEMARLLDGIAQKVLAPTRYPFVDSEGFRLARPIIAVLEREALPLADVVAWVERVGGTDRRNSFVAGRDNAWHHNTMALLTALHLMITYREVPESARTEVLPAVHRALKSFIPWFL
ncbi:MAG: hypothetical protein JWN15_705, partial [Firmicutes bacterium]|nr:hypothetical protein [Bacillota bacterium]